MVILVHFPQQRKACVLFNAQPGNWRAGARIVVPVIGGKRGHPVGFSAHFLARLLALTGDTGAREILTTDAAHVDEIRVDDAGIFVDIGTMADLKRQTFAEPQVSREGNSTNH